jgi:monofunctional biosynthetic peptidoglycan transglycosylase
VAYNPYKNLSKVLKRSDMILRLLRQRGVMSETEYQSALAQSPNVGRLQIKIDENISTPPVFASPSSALIGAAEKPIEKELEKKDRDAPLPHSDAVPTNPADSQIDKK